MQIKQLIQTLISETIQSAGFSSDSVDQAKRTARRRLRSNPTDTQAAHILAVCSLGDNQPTEAVNLMTLACDTDSGNAEGHRIIGYALLLEKSFSKAIVHFEMAVRLDPFLHDCWYLAGKICSLRNQTERAITFFGSGVIPFDPQHRCARALARIYSRRLQYFKAIKILYRAIARDERNHILNFYLATILARRAEMYFKRSQYDAQQKSLDEAISRLEIAISAHPTSRYYSMAGVMHARRNNHAQAEENFRKAIELNPKSPLPITQIATTCVDNGEIDRALKLFKRSMDIDDRFVTTHYRYSRAKKFVDNSETQQYIVRLRKLLDDPTNKVAQEVQLCFALAKVLDDIGQHDEAWTLYDQANTSKNSAHPNFRSDRQRPQVSSIGLCDRATIQQRQVKPNHNLTPVFVVGMPRSGTTLTEQILSSHQLIHGAGELSHIGQIRRDLSMVAGVYGDAFSCPDNMKSISQDRLVKYANDHCAYLRSLCDTATHVVDKMPTNFLNLGLIATLFPNAKIIHLRRNPMDVMVSCYCQNLSPPFCNLEEFVDYHAYYREAMKHWEQELPLPILNVDYEMLVADQENQSRRLIEYCGLDWDATCLDFHLSTRSVHTPSKWQVRQPMYTTSVAKWRRFERHISHLESRLSA